MKISAHVHRIGNDIVAAYLIDTDEGVTLIDAGLPGHWRDFQRELVAMGRTTVDVRGIVLTHGDGDHIGFAERLRKETGIPVYVHAADADRAKGGDKPKPPSSRSRFPISFWLSRPSVWGLSVIPAGTTAMLPLNVAHLLCPLVTALNLICGP